MTESQNNKKDFSHQIIRLVPDKLRGSYRAKLIVSVFVVVLLLGVVGGINYFQAEQTLEEDASQEMTSTVEMQADAVNEWMTSMETHTRSVSSASALVDADPSSAEEHLIQDQAMLPVDIRAIHLVDGDDQTVTASTDPDADTLALNESSDPWTDIEPGVDLTSSDDVWHSETAYQSDRMDDQVMAFASPISGDETNIAVLIGTLGYRVDNLHQSHDNQETVVFDAEGNIIFASGTTGTQINQSDIESVATDRSATQYEDQDNPTAYASVEDYDWAAATVAPADEVYAASDAVGTSVLSIIGVALIALLGLGVAVNRQTSRPLRDLGTKAKQMEDGDLDVELETQRIDEFGDLYDRFDAMRESLQMTIIEAEEAQREVETERERLEKLTDELVETAESFSNTMQQAADGDLTVQMDPQTDNEAMQMVAEQFNAMIAEFNDTINHLNAFSDQVVTASTETTDAVDALESSSRQVAESIDEIASGATEQSESLQTVTDEMNSLSATIEEIASSSDEVAALASRTADTGAQGQETAADATQRMEETEQKAKQAVDAIGELENEVEHIDELIDRISEIAEQTNVLALNANIEAARQTGEGGDGFAVVATEIKDLSEEVKTTAEEVETRISTIQQQTDNVVNVVEATSQRSQIASEQVHTTVESLDQIAAYARQTNDGVQEISDATEEQAATTEEVVNMVDEVAAISEETTAEADTVASSAEEQVTSLETVAESMRNLSEQAEQLSLLLDDFTTDTNDR